MSVAPRRLPVKSAAVLWVFAPLILALSTIRPATSRSDRASRLPTSVAGFKLKRPQKITPAIERLLGTRDVAWWVVNDEVGNVYYLTVVFHDSNWKSLHPPHICIRGSNFQITADQTVTDTIADGREVTVGRLVASVKDQPAEDYVSLYAFVGRDFVTPHFFWGFYLSHAPRALFRQATPGFLLRVEAFVGKDGLRATERRCWRMFQAFLPVGESLIRER